MYGSSVASKLFVAGLCGIRVEVDKGVFCSRCSVGKLQERGKSTSLSTCAVFVLPQTSMSLDTETALSGCLLITLLLS